MALVKKSKKIVSKSKKKSIKTAKKSSKKLKPTAFDDKIVNIMFEIPNSILTIYLSKNTSKKSVSEINSLISDIFKNNLSNSRFFWNSNLLTVNDNGKRIIIDKSGNSKRDDKPKSITYTFTAKLNNDITIQEFIDIFQELKSLLNEVVYTLFDYDNFPEKIRKQISGGEMLIGISNDDRPYFDLIASTFLHIKIDIEKFFLIEDKKILKDLEKLSNLSKKNVLLLMKRVYSKRVKEFGKNDTNTKFFKSLIEGASKYV